LSCGSEGVDDRAGQVGAGVFALADKVLEHPLHPSQVGQLVLDLRQAVRGDVTDRRPVGAFLEMQQFGNFLKGESRAPGLV
jgi:hypothetical protein